MADEVSVAPTRVLAACKVSKGLLPDGIERLSSKEEMAPETSGLDKFSRMPSFLVACCFNGLAQSGQVR